jgi:PmbA protein
MEKLLDLAGKAGCEAEAYAYDSRTVELSRREGRVVETSASLQSGVALRIIRDGRLGTAYTKNLEDRQSLLDRAVLSLENGPEVEFQFHRGGLQPDTGSFDETVGDSGFDQALEACVSLESLTEGLPSDCIDTSAGSAVETIRVASTSGDSLLHRSSGVFGHISVRYPGTETGLSTGFAGVSRIPADEGTVRRMCGMYTDSLPEVSAGEGKMKVMLTPGSLYGVLWRLTAAAGARAFHAGATPLRGKTGEKILSEKLTLSSDPDLDPPVVRRRFDDEGVPTRRVALFDRGVFTGPYTNLFYSGKIGVKPTGTGFRSSMWGGDPVALPPEPSFRNGTFETGDHTFEEMLGMMDSGILAFGLLGAHSGNIINGDFSVGFNPGLLVRDGRVVGRVKDGMMAGNVYEVLQRVIAIQNTPFNPMSTRRDPAILLASVSVSGR